MNRKIYKYTVPVDDQTHTIEIPDTHAKLLHVGHQGRVDEVLVWIEVQPDAELVKRRFRVFATGQEFPGFPDDSSWHYVGTVVYAAVDLVWHLYTF